MESVSAIGNNSAASQAARALADVFSRHQDILARLASGRRLNKPNVDPAGLAASQRLASQVQQIDAGSVNVANARSLTQVQEGFRAQIASVVSDLGALAIRAQDPTLNASDQANIQAVAAANQSFINQTVSTADFNGVPVFQSSDLQTVSDGDGGTVTLSAVNLGASIAAGGVGGTGVTTGSISDPSALNNINAAINNLARAGATIGADQVELGFVQDTNALRSQNLTAAVSRIRDADVAQESANLGLLNTLLRAGISNLSRANSAPQSLLNVLA